MTDINGQHYFDFISATDILVLNKKPENLGDCNVPEEIRDINQLLFTFNNEQKTTKKEK